MPCVGDDRKQPCNCNGPYNCTGKEKVDILDSIIKKF